ncbi:phytochelatin synthase [Fragilariopsis cylindrus CCMP1102]|uniref:glutathione gamma-glutamylcysteinyltransferase n=1 Tax=Fragilariopsis cylindrus CCMP1102 TaxID=635003 RepID=A0A1E7FGF7_9STRA|nr:phytochelatin synthase [Fragilariopsis cylindrus CCMP1102]|eukprot:OEU16863.1 phytochelatin synthase [Fragilariopsis cylindrus CCMP1102]
MKSTGSSSSCSECKPTPEPLPENIPSFYQRKLPETCIAFASREGKNIFKSSLEKDGLKSFYNLIEQHHTQTEPAFCGVSTLVMVLNSLAVDPGQHWKGPWRWYSEEMLNCCVDMDDIKKAGITLRDFHCLALCQGLSVDLQYCDETSSLDAFREAVERACVGSDDDDDDDDDEQQKDEGKNRFEVMVVSYSRAVLKQTGSGHFSPIAAYDKASDSVLILDTARFKYGAHWTKLPLIYDAMKPIDPDTGKPRGYALLSFVPDSQRCVEVSKCKNANDVSKQKVSKQKSDNKKSKTTSSALSTQPASIIFRSKMNQKQRRRLYKEYITCLRRDEKYKGGDIPYDAVRAFWCERDSNRPVRVWEIIEPVRVNSVEENQMLQRMRKYSRI